MPPFPTGRAHRDYRFNDRQMSAIDLYLRTLACSSTNTVHPRFLQAIVFGDMQHVSPASTLVAMSLNRQGPIERFDFEGELGLGQEV